MGGETASSSHMRDLETVTETSGIRIFRGVRYGSGSDYSGELKNSVNIPLNYVNVWHMLLILDGISQIGAHDWSDLGYLICLRRVFRSRADTNMFVFSKKTYFSSYVRNMF